MTPRIFRTYQGNADQGYHCTVVQAARATTAAPNLFKPMAIISGGLTETFIGASLQYSNITNLALDEAVAVFDLSQPVACLVNIGPGNSGHISWNPNNVFGQTMMQLLHDIATNCEAQAEAFAKQYIKTPGFFYRLSVHQGLQKMAVDDWNRQGEIKTHSLAYLQEAETAKQLNDIANTLNSCPQKTTLQALRGDLSINANVQKHLKLAQALLPPVPAPSPLFTGRENILLLLEKCFDPSKPSVTMEVQLHCVLYGLGGAGKTQIAQQFCHKSGNSSEASIVKSLTVLAEKAKLEETTSATALTWLCYQKEEWLLIFDNADDPKINLQPFFPDCKHGNILITSRNDASKIYAPNNHYKIGGMSPEDSLAVFYKASQRSESEETAANELVEELGYLALAIVRAGSYLLINGHKTIKQYLEDCRKDMSRYMTEIPNQTIDKYQLSVFATWDLSDQKLEENAKTHEVNTEELQGKNMKELQGVNTKKLQDFLRRFLINNNKWSDDLVEEAVEGKKYEEAEKLQKEVLKVTTEAFGNTHPDTLEVMSRLASTFWKGGKLGEAETLKRKVLQIRKRDFESNHPSIILAMLNLAPILCKAGKLEEAEKLTQEVVKIKSKALGNSHPDTLLAMSNLAATFKLTGRLEEAEKIQQQVLRVRTEAFESSHLDTLQARTYLA
ncbi:hypothetical protein C0993_008687 [Termitomyces sp. T159_Od127]|nr:hypothetical protein C0993_008687 [Termitomyces sp. T159_Od127]